MKERGFINCGGVPGVRTGQTGEFVPSREPGKAVGAASSQTQARASSAPQRGLLPWHSWSFVRTGNCCFKLNKIDLSAPTRRHHGNCLFPLTLQKARETPNIVKFLMQKKWQKKKKTSLCEYWIKCANHTYTLVNNVQSLYAQTRAFTVADPSLSVRI